MVKQIRYRGITWIDLESPAKEELANLAKTYDLHPVVISELATPSPESKLDLYDGYIYLVLRLPHSEIRRGSKPQSDVREIDFVLGKDFLLTTHYELVETVEEFAQIFEADLAGHKTTINFHAGYLLYYILRRLYRSLGEDLTYINEQLKKAEAKVFSGEEEKIVERLAEINRSLLDFRWEIKSHHSVIADLVSAGKELYGESFAHYLGSISHTYDKVWHMLENNLDIFDDLRATNESLLSIKTNETVKLLTVLAFIFFPLTMITGIFNMNTSLPFVGQPNDFLIVISLMLITTLVMFSIAKLRRWL